LRISQTSYKLLNFYLI